MKPEKDVAEPGLSEFEDELEPFIEESKKDPAFRAEYEDVEERFRIIDCLIGLRRAHHLTQTAVAERMGVRQPTVSGFETEGSDPRLSTLQRYARAVHARLWLKVELPADCDWASPGLSAYGRDRPEPKLAPSSVRKKGDLAHAWIQETERNDDSRALTA